MFKDFVASINNDMISKEIVYPFFLECSSYCKDIFWENVFEDLAYGKAPYGTYINKNFICCNYKGKEFSYKLESKDDSKQLHDDIYSLLINKLGLLSCKDKVKKRVDFYEIEEKIRDGRKNWSDIKKKNIKDILIEKYTSDMKNKHGLTTKQAKYLLSVIFIAMVFKVITSKDIEYKDDKIVRIKGICFENNNIILERNIYRNSLEIDTKPALKKCKNTLSDNWEKYIVTIKKLISSLENEQVSS